MEQIVVFGSKINGVNYKVRRACYAVIFDSTKEKIAVVQTSRGHYFLPGGGIEGAETPVECLRRELLEETGFEISIGSIIGRAKRYFRTPFESILNDAYFYRAELLSKTQEPIEDDHILGWISVEGIKESLFHEHQSWAVLEGLK